MLEIKIFVDPDSTKYAELKQFLSLNNYDFTSAPILPKDYVTKRFSPPFRIGKKQKRAVLDSKGLEVLIVPKGAEKLAELYCSALNKELQVDNN